MELGDYDHDGRATEFVLPVDMPPPRSNARAVLVGISRINPRLHDFGIMLQPWRWELIKEKGSSSFVEWACGDHASEIEETRTIRVDAEGLHDLGLRTRKCE